MSINNVLYFDNALPGEICKEIINKFEKSKDQQVDTVLENHRSFKEINITKSPGWKDVQDGLLDILQQALKVYKEQFNIDEKSWPEKYGFEELRMKRYMPNDKDEFQFHVDVQNYANARRFLVYFWYLNDVEVGGETAFQNTRTSEPLLQVKPVEGRLIMFPPLWTHPHIGKKPISGPKYILGGYLHYV
jgi:hypothetical protein